MEKKKKDDNDGDLFGVAEDESNEQFMATKPWIGALVAPTEGIYYYFQIYLISVRFYIKFIIYIYSS